ncbi:mitochondrial import protein TIM15, partial [Tanacetum coccineum]
TTNTTSRLCFGLKSRFSGLKWKVDKRVVVSSSAVAENEYQAEGATIDPKLPRRSLLVHFTCDACGVRSQRLINRLAYEKGLVYVQCSGCSQYHKLVDNLDLVVEYDFREEINTSSDTDQA